MNDLLIYSVSLLIYQLLTTAEEHRLRAFWQGLQCKTSIRTFKSLIRHGARSYGIIAY